jgi:hypothetical protein
LARWFFGDGVLDLASSQVAAVATGGSTSLLHTPDAEVLTPYGRAIEIALRLLGPVLLGLAVLAVRGRLKR